jgi:hypothetical protein
MVRKNKLESLSVTCFSNYFSLFEEEASLNKRARGNYTSLFVQNLKEQRKMFHNIVRLCMVGTNKLESLSMAQILKLS